VVRGSGRVYYGGRFPLLRRVAGDVLWLYRFVRDEEDRDLIRDIIIGKEIDREIEREILDKLDDMAVNLPAYERREFERALNDLNNLSERDLKDLEAATDEDWDQVRDALGDQVEWEQALRWEASRLGSTLVLFPKNIPSKSLITGSRSPRGVLRKGLPQPRSTPPCTTFCFAVPASGSFFFRLIKILPRVSVSRGVHAAGFCTGPIISVSREVGPRICRTSAAGGSAFVAIETVAARERRRHRLVSWNGRFTSVRWSSWSLRCGKDRRRVESESFPNYSTLTDAPSLDGRPSGESTFRKRCSGELRERVL
jgi:hypothetical protein